MTREGSLCAVTHLIDIALTNFIARRVFASSLEELPPQTISFVGTLVKHFKNVVKEKQMDFEHMWFYRREVRKITGLSNTRVHKHINLMVDHEILTSKRDQNGFAYRFIFEPEQSENGLHIDRLQLVRIGTILKRATKKERQEYKDFIPYLKQIFLALDPASNGEEI